jgi:5-methyltetrahydrofolate corrinoid/iron sulfur protein methyltransferase
MSGILLIGERINSTNTRMRQVLETRDEEALVRIAREQVQGGASYIDVNASMLMQQEKEALRWAAQCIVAEIGVGISLDSPNTEILLGVLPDIDGGVILNSFTCDDESLERAFTAALDRGSGVIVMLKNREGIPGTVDGRMHLADAVQRAADAAGVPPELVYIDPVFTPLATSTEGLQVVLGTISALKDRYPAYRRIGGLSNVSFGLPMRKTVNRTFLTMALSHGLDTVICDTTDTVLMDSLAAAEAVIGLDPGCRRILKRYREKKPR